MVVSPRSALCAAARRWPAAVAFSMLACFDGLPSRLCRGIFALLLYLWQLTALAPLAYCTRRTAYCNHAVITSSVVIRTLVLLLGAPFLFWLSSALYGVTNVAHSTLFTRIAQLTMAGDMFISLALLVVHLWQRQHLAKLLNMLVLLQSTPLRWSHVLLLCAKLLLSLYELLCNVPFFRRIAARLAWPQLLAYGMQLYVQHLSSVYANGIFAMLLLLFASLQQLEQQWLQCSTLSIRTIDRLLRREKRLLHLCFVFVRCFQLGIFLVLIGHFLNILANMYAMLDYYVSQHGVPLTMSNYCLIVTVELYSLVLVAQLCQLQHQRVRQLSVKCCYAPPDLDKSEAQLQQLQIPIYPWEILKLPILGLFVLNNSFWLFLVTYAANFIVIILQFTLEHMH